MNQGMFAQQPRAFGNMPQPQTNEEPESFLEVMLGTAAESVVDIATYGIWQPDIIDETSEANSRIAATIGHVAGSIAGFLPSFGVAGAGAKGIMGAFKFSTKIFSMAEKMKTTAQATGKATQIAQAFKPLALKGLGDAVPSFILYDVSREFIRQVKENDPDLSEIGYAAIRGGITGFFTGSIAAGFSLEPILNQSLAMASSMALAETINDASEGEDVLSDEYFTDRVLPNFAMGAILGLFGSRGVEARKAAFSTDVIKHGKTMMDEKIVSKDPVTGKMVFKDAFEDAKELGINLHRELGKLDPKNKIAYNLFFKKWGENIFGEADRLRTAQGRVHQFTKALGIKEKSKEYKELISSVVEKKTSTKDFTKDDYVVFNTYVEDLAKGFKTKKEILLDQFPKLRGAGMGEQNVAPFNVVMKRTGLSDLTDPITWAKLQHQVESETLYPMIQKEYEIIKESILEGMKKGTYKSIAAPKPVEKVGIAPKAFGKVVDFVSGAPNASEKNVMREIFAMFESETGGVGLTGKAKEAFKDLQNIQEYMRQRSNQVLKAMGKPEISKKGYYMHHIIDREALAKQGKKRGEMPRQEEIGTERPIYIAEAPTKFSTERMESVQYKRESNLPYIEDPVRAIMSMIRQDLKIIYLHEPVKILDAEVKILKKAGVIDNAGIDSIGKFVNQHIFEQPTKMTKVVNTQITRWLEESKIGQVVDKFLLDSGHWVGDNPVNAFAQMWGSGTAKAFLAFNPKMSMLNALQFLNTNGFVKSKYIAKAMLPNDMQPALAIKNMNESQIVHVLRGKMLDVEQMLKGSLEKSGMHTFQNTTTYAVEKSYLSGWHAFMDKLTNPALVKEGWQSQQGIDLRKVMRSRIGTSKELPTDKNWNYTITNEEKILFNKALEFVTDNTNFMYNAVGSTSVMRSAVTRPFFTLTSYPMNYFYKYIGNLWYQMINGQPAWAKGTKIKLPLDERYGIAKHLIGLGFITAVLAKTTDLDYNKMTGTPLPFGLKESGVLSWSPSPAMTFFGGIMDRFSNDPRTKAEGENAIWRSLPIPYQGVARQTKRIVEGEKTGTDLLFYRKYKKPAKRTNNAFQGFQGFNNKAFKGF